MDGRVELETSSNDRVLEIGAGKSPDDRATVTLDIREDLDHIDHPGVDIAVDQWPVKTDSFHMVIANHVLEHVAPDKLPHIFEEVDRVLRSGGTFHVRVPHPGSWDAVTDPTHFGSGGWTPDVKLYFSGELEQYWPDLDWSIDAWATVEAPTFIRPKFRVHWVTRKGSRSYELVKFPFVTAITEFVAVIP